MGYYKNIQEKIAGFSNSKYDYYIYGLYGIDESYKGRRKMFASGVRDKIDIERFLDIREELSSYRIYNNKGEKINLKNIKKEYGIK